MLRRQDLGHILSSMNVVESYAWMISFVKFSSF